MNIPDVVDCHQPSELFENRRIRFKGMNLFHKSRHEQGMLTDIGSNIKKHDFIFSKQASNIPHEKKDIFFLSSKTEYLLIQEISRVSLIYQPKKIRAKINGPE